MAGAFGAAAGGDAGTGVAVGAAAGAGVALASTVYEALAVVPLVCPLASTPYWPAASVGTTKVTPKAPLVSTVPVPTVAPLKLSSTVSPGWNPPPEMVREAPGA